MSGGGCVVAGGFAMLKSRRLSKDAQLQKASENSPALARGVTGSGVGLMQDILSILGFDLLKSLKHGSPDGIFGPETESAVKAFQKRYNLKADGVAGKLTLDTLDEIILRNPPLESPPPHIEHAVGSHDSGAPLTQKRTSYW